MGRIKTALIKRVTNELVEKHKDSFTKDYEENKAIVENFADIPSKKLKNIIAGYVTRLVKNTKEI
ncbi:30S ribosomal protein S17e [Candidatus Woesearchaeota archaeon]|nr:MAG: 30S ribosomal protein S17e [Candidatus Woesearchaeota archaeon]